MAKKKQRRTRISHKKKPDYERFEYGPFTVERLGTEVVQRFHMNTEDHRLFRQRVWETRTERLREFEAARDEILHILRSYSPIPLLQDAFIRHCLGFSETTNKLREERVEAHLEYLLNLAMAIPLGEEMLQPEPEVYERVATLLRNAFQAAMSYFASEAAQPGAHKADELRFEAILRTLFLRGSSYSTHHCALIRAVFEPHDESIRQRLGFTAGELLTAAVEIERQVEEGVRATPAWFDEITALHDRFRGWVETEEAKELKSIEALREAFLSLSGVSEARNRAEQFLHNGALNMMMLRPSPDLSPSLLDALTLRPGENEAFLQPPISGSPLNRGGAHDHPLLRIGSEVFAFSPSMLFRNLEPILLQAFVGPGDSLDDRFIKSRHEVLLDLVSQQFVRLLPGCVIYRSLRYRPNPARADRLLEVDLLVTFDRYLFIIEGKAGGFSEEAQRGSLPAIRKKFDELLLKAFDQTGAADRYIQDAGEALFVDQNGAETLVLRAEILRRRFQVCVTLSEMGFLTAQLGHLQELGAVPEGMLPWAVFVNDLQVISEILESPSDFLLYLDRRLSIQSKPQLRVIDELDYFMYFVLRGLYLDADAFRQHSHIRFDGFTDGLDRYYLSLQGKVDPVDKPARKVHPEIRQLASIIENSRKPDRYEVSTFLLGLDGETQRELVLSRALLREKLIHDGKSHGVNMRFNSESTCLSLVLGPSKDRSWIKLHRERDLLRKYQGKLWRCISMYIASDSDSSKDDVMFELLEGEWRPDEVMERRLAEFQIAEATRAMAKDGVPGRNEICPCGSGLKFKKCCLRAIVPKERGRGQRSTG